MFDILGQTEKSGFFYGKKVLVQALVKKCFNYSDKLAKRRLKKSRGQSRLECEYMSSEASSLEEVPALIRSPV